MAKTPKKSDSKLHRIVLHEMGIVSKELAGLKADELAVLKQAKNEARARIAEIKLQLEDMKDLVHELEDLEDDQYIGEIEERFIDIRTRLYNRLAHLKTMAIMYHIHTPARLRKTVHYQLGIK